MAWEDDYRDHELWGSVMDALEALSEVPAEEFTDGLVRLRALLTEISGHADQPHPSLTTAHLTTVQGVVDSIKASLPDAHAEVLTRTQNHQSKLTLVDQLAQYVRTWPPTGTTRLSGLSQRAEEVETTFNTLNERLNARLAEVEGQLNDQSETIATAREQQATYFDRQGAEFAALIEQKTKALQDELDRIHEDSGTTDAAIEQQKSRLDTALSDQQEKFAALQEERSTKWAELLRSNEDEFQGHLEVLRGYEEQSQKVLSAVGVNATATDYGKYANDQGQAADKWRGWAVFAFSVAATAFIAAAIASFLGYGGDAGWWQIAFQKLSAPLGASAIGYMLIRESGQHRKEERASRQVQLTLTALEPFIANLPPEDKKVVRLETARRLFAVQQGDSPKIASASEVKARE
ncbi:hypothetical protein [Janibacter hoylei]|uniref:hypothetical protein n=1 Tax=Janibacter hoylei TaxID=364298 RepID=UPI0027B98A76|nr:hypothetical protein [Janibacter hoylei]